MEHLISDKLVRLIEKNSDTILKRWQDRLKADPATSSFTEKDLHKFALKAQMVMKELGKWVGYDTPKEDVGRKYAVEGGGLFNMNIPLCEGIRALTLLKRTLWLFVVYESAFETALELNQMRELNDRVVLFFDRAEYYFIRGYMEAMNNKIKETWDISDSDTEIIFFKKSFYNK
jgi:hypothetical protein